MLALAVYAGVILLVLAASLLVTPRYKAVASVLVDARGADPAQAQRVDSSMAQSFVATQADVILSERVVLKAVDALGLVRDAQLSERWLSATDGQGDFRAWLARHIIEHLEVRPARDSSLITVAYQGRDPKFAADTTNAIVRGYIDTALELRVEPARLEHKFNQERVEQLREEFSRAQGRLASYQRERGLVPTDDRIDLESTRLAELSTQLVALQTAQAGTSGRQSQARGRSEQLPEVMSNAAVSPLLAEIARQEASLSEATRTLGERHPRIIEQRARLAALQGRLQSYSQRVTSGLEFDNVANVAQVARMQALVEQQREKLLRIKSERDEADVLLGDVQSARKAYEQARERANLSGTESLVRHVNVSVLQVATPPITKATPRLGLNLAAAACVGLLLAFGAVLLAERLDARLRVPDDVVDSLGIPVLALLHGNDAESRIRVPLARLPQPAAEN